MECQPYMQMSPPRRHRSTSARRVLPAHGSGPQPAASQCHLGENDPTDRNKKQDAASVLTFRQQPMRQLISGLATQTGLLHASKLMEGTPLLPHLPLHSGSQAGFAGLCCPTGPENYHIGPAAPAPNPSAAGVGRSDNQLGPLFLGFGPRYPHPASQEKVHRWTFPSE